MPSITEIPTELLGDILKHSGQPLTLTKVCWRFNDIATPILYREIRLEPLKRLTICLILRTFIDKPALGDHVRCLRVHLIHPIPDPIRNDQFISFIPDGFTAAAESHRIALEIRQGIAKESIPAMIFLLLCYLPALQRFAVTFQQVLGQDDHAVYLEMFTTSPLLSALQSVRFLELSFTGISRQSIGWDMIMSFLRLPALESFHAAHLLVKGAISNPPTSGSSNVEHIELDDSEFDEEILDALISSPRSLRIFVFKEFDETAPVLYLLPTIGDALRKYSLNTLERLVIFGWRNNKKTGLLGSLSNFSRLTYIRITCSLLLGVPDLGGTSTIALRLRMILPASVVSLILGIDRTWKDVNMVQVVEQLLNNRHDNLRHLKDLYFPGISLKSDEDMIKSLCLAEGIEYRWISSF